MDKNADHKIARDEGKSMLAAKSVFNAIDKNKDGFANEEEWSEFTAMIAKGEHGIFALRGPGTGDVTATHVLWKQKRGVATVPSPLFYKGRVYLVQDGGRVTCYASGTGDTIYEQERLGVDGEYYASPVGANGNIYLCSVKGTITVIEAGENLKVLARNPLNDRIMATPAIADDKLYIRTGKHLWAFGK
jgi:outer membrane protein assembly factor BamB